MIIKSVDEEEQRELGHGCSSKPPTPQPGKRLSSRSGNNRSGSIPTMNMWRKESVPIIENEAENDESEEAKPSFKLSPEPGKLITRRASTACPVAPSQVEDNLLSVPKGFTSSCSAETLTGRTNHFTV